MNTASFRKATSLSASLVSMGGIQNTTPDEIEAVIREAVANEINLFDLRAGGASVYARSEKP